MDETSEIGPEDTRVSPAVPAQDEPPPGGVSRTVYIVSVVVALLIAGVAGLVIGWKVEQQRVKDDLSNIRPIGTVTALDDDSVTIALQTADGSKTYVLTDRTTVHGSGDMAEGSTVLVRSWRGAEGGLEANEIVVLPDEP